MLRDDPEGWGGRAGGRLVKEQAYNMADSWCCTAETNTTLESNYIPVEKDGEHLELSGWAQCNPMNPSKKLAEESVGEMRPKRKAEARCVQEAVTGDSRQEKDTTCHRLL